MSGAHAKLSASSAHRWMTCTASVHMEEGLPDNTSIYAEEGTLAHSIAELKLRKAYTDPMGPRKYGAALKKLQEHELYAPEMLGHTDTYKDYIDGITHAQQSKPYVTVEKRVDYSAWAEGGFGTADCIVITGDTLYVTDFKYGKGVYVDAENNPQMMLYALGAYQVYCLIYPIKRVRMAIVQPRIPSISEWETTVEALLAFGETVKSRAAEALAGGRFAPGDKQCRFCKAKATCRARANQNLELAKYEFKDADKLTSEDLGAILKQADELKRWVSDVEDEALKTLLSGGRIPGWKAVEGRSNRVFKDTDEAFAALIASGVSQDMLYERRPITLSAAEKLVGAKTFSSVLANHIIKPQGKPTLAQATDPRPEYQQTTIQNDFKEIVNK